MEVPVLTVNGHCLRNLVTFIYGHEQMLIEYGAIKLQQFGDCELALKKYKTLNPLPIIQKSKKVNKHATIYMIHQNHQNKSNPATLSLSIQDELLFWLTLSDCDEVQRQAAVTIYPNNSFFYEKWHRRYFSIYQIPRQSILSLLGRRVMNQFRPVVTHANSSKSIFPLTMSQYNLPNLIYHHGDGPRYWFIIPSDQKPALMNLINEFTDSKCLKHDDLFIDSIVLDENHIRYHRIVQYKGEIVVLGAGTIAQSFALSEHWSESIPFGLPSWIHHGHAKAYEQFCTCCDPRIKRVKKLDLSLLTENSINVFLEKKQNKFNTVDSTQLPSEIEFIDTNLFDLTESTLSSICEMSTISSFDRRNDDDQNAMQIESERNIWSNHLTDSLSLQTCLNSDIVLPTDITELMNQSCFDEYLVEHSNHIDVTSNINPVDNFDLIDFPADCVFSSNNLPSTNLRETELTGSSHPEFIKSSVPSIRRRRQRQRNSSTTLFVSGLRGDVTISTLYKHFFKALEITVRPCRTAEHLQCAFILHKTVEDARRNLQQPIDRNAFGEKCQVEFVDQRKTSRKLPSYPFQKKKLIVLIEKLEKLSENHWLTFYSDDTDFNWSSKDLFDNNV